MIIDVKRPTFAILLENPNEIYYDFINDPDLNKYKIITVLKFNTLLPDPSSDEILYRYSPKRGYYLNINKSGPTNTKKYYEPDIPAKKNVNN